MVKPVVGDADADRDVGPGPVGDQPAAAGVEGVANVSIWGFRDRQLQVLVDPQRLGERTTLNQVIKTAGNALEVSPLTFLEASTPGTGGFIDTVNQRLHIFHEQAISTPDELAQVPIEDPGATTPNGVGRGRHDVVEDHQPLIGDAICAGGELPVARRREVSGRQHRRGGRGCRGGARRDAPGLGDMRDGLVSVPPGSVHRLVVRASRVAHCSLVCCSCCS